MSLLNLQKKDILKLIQEKGVLKTKDHVKELLKANQLPIASDIAIKKSIENIKQQYNKISKNKKRPNYSTDIEKLNNEQYKFPEPNLKSHPQKPKLLQTGRNENTSIAESLYHVSLTLGKEVHELMCENEKLGCENKVKRSLQIENKEKTKKIKTIEAEKIQLTNHYKDELRIVQENIAIEKDKKVLTLKTNNKALKKAKSFLCSKVQQKQLCLKRSQLKCTYFQKKCNNLQRKLTIEKEKVLNLNNEKVRLNDDIDRQAQVIKDIQVEKRELEEEREWLIECVNNYNEDVITFDGYKYSYELQQTIYKLLECHVSYRNIPEVINTVCKLVGKRVSHLPSQSTINNLNVQRLIISQKQIGEEFNEKQNLTLLSDETTKYEKRMEGIHCTDEDGREWVLGLREIETKAASNVFNTFQDILADIDRASHAADSEKSRTILANITARVSDRAATELKLGELIESARLEILPIMKDGFNELTDDEKAEVGNILVFSCGLHGLVHFADSANTSLIESEKGLFNQESAPVYDKSFAKKTESATVRLIRTCSKAFSKGGDEKSGCHLEFVSYIQPFLKQHKIHSLPLAPFRGNRFNILFANADHLFFLHKQFIQFLNGREGNNRLLQAVLHDLKVPELVAGCKALGLISKFVSTPLWTLIEDKSIHILDMSEKYQQLVTALNHAALHVTDFMEGNILPFEHTPVNEDYFLDALLAPFEYDHLVQTHLEVLLPALAKLSEKLYKDHLDGGKYSNIGRDSDLYHRTKGTPKHNKFSESVFGYIDGLMKNKPNVSILSCEAYVMFSMNKTSEWLNGKSEQDVEKILSEARREASSTRKEFQERHKNILEFRRQETLRKQEKAEAHRLEKLRKLQEYTDQIVDHGLWQSEEQVQRLLNLYDSKSEKMKALKTQVRFHKFVLQQEPEDKGLLSFSKDKRQLSVEELTDNVCKLIKDAGSRTAPDGEEHIVVGKEIRHKFNVGGTDKWFQGRVISQVY